MDNTTQIVGFLCEHQEAVVAVLGFLATHLGLSVASATLKKLGVSKGKLVAIVRLLAVDVQPTPTTVLANAEEVKQTGRVSIANPPTQG